MAVAQFILTNANVTPAQVDADCTAIAAELSADTAIPVFVGGRIHGIEVDGSAPATAVGAATTTGTYTIVVNA